MMQAATCAAEERSDVGRLNLNHLGEQHRIGALLVGATPGSDWQPEYWPHRAMVDALERVRAETCSGDAVDLALVLDALRTSDAEWPWAQHVGFILDEYERFEDILADRRAAKRDVIKIFGLILDAEAALDARVTDLLTAREAAEHALETLNRAYAMFDGRARDILRSAA